VTDTAMPAPSLQRQVPAFAVIGLFGYVLDSAITVAGVKGLHLDPLVARLPAFAVATTINFWLNRFFTFSGSRASLLSAFLRYWLVSGLGLTVNWSVYALALKSAALVGAPTTPEVLPIFVACGTGVAMFITFFGFKLFAFRR